MNNVLTMIQDLSISFRLQPAELSVAPFLCERLEAFGVDLSTIPPDVASSLVSRCYYAYDKNEWNNAIELASIVAWEYTQKKYIDDVWDLIELSSVLGNFSWAPEEMAEAITKAVERNEYEVSEYEGEAE